jgi:HSP20 family molecular chaperone IbpA
MAETLPVRKPKTIVDEIEKMQDRVMQRAFDIFTMNGRTFGREIDGWLQAERELVWTPSIELQEKDNEFRLEIAVPGVDPKDIDIEVTSQDILVKAAVEHEHKEKKGQVYACEFATGKLFQIDSPAKKDQSRCSKSRVQERYVELKSTHRRRTHKESPGASGMKRLEARRRASKSLPT